MSFTTMMITGLLVPLLATSSTAEDPPVNPSDEQIEQARATKDTQALEVGRLAGLVTNAESEIAQLQVRAENASSDYLTAQGALEQARVTATRTATEADEAGAGVDAATAALARFARSSYIQGSTLNNDFMLLDSNGPAELIERAGLLDALSDNQLDVVAQMELARTRKANADSTQRQAVLTMRDAERRAASALAVAESTLTNAETQLSQLEAERAQYQAQLRSAQEALLGIEGARALYEEYAAQEAAAAAERQRVAEETARRNKAAEDAAGEEARNNPPPPHDDGSSAREGGGGSATPAPDPGPPVSSGGWVSPSSGNITSCYCMRWGEFHAGLDFAAPMYDPIYAVGPGTVVRAGEASGFGLAVYIQHDNGDVTVYGHEEVIKVSEGQRVFAGQVVALIGTRGFSTGPHVHFEVTNGLYGSKMDPVAWLEDRGVNCTSSYCG